jgi:hypothetical protein
VSCLVWGLRLDRREGEGDAGAAVYGDYPRGRSERTCALAFPKRGFVVLRGRAYRRPEVGIGTIS